MKINNLIILFFLFIWIGCAKEEPDTAQFVPKNDNGFAVLPKPIRSLCVDGINLKEGQVNESLYDVFNAYVLSYKQSAGIRNKLGSLLVNSSHRNVKFSDAITEGNQVFFNFLNQTAHTGVKNCHEISCVNPYFSYEGYDYEVALTYFNKANPNVVFEESIIFALGQDFVDETNEFENTIPAILLDFHEGKYSSSEIGLSEKKAHLTSLPIIIFNFMGLGKELDDNMPVYDSIGEPDSIIEDKSQYFNLYAIGVKAGLRFENDNYSEFLVHQTHNFCCSNGWGPDFSRIDRDMHIKIHKNKIGQHVSPDWGLWTYVDYSNFNEEHWWSKFGFYEYDWWAIGKNTCIASGNGGACIPWQIQARFNHEWYVAINTFKNDVLFTYYGQIVPLSTSNGYVQLMRK